MNIILTGFMGSGKSSVGKKLARALNFGFIDTDAIIEKDVGMSITTIFKRKGEPYFREMESKAIALVSMLDNQVIATGGGVPLRETNMQELERNGMVVHLKVSPENVLKRIGHDTSRPLLQTKDPLETARAILSKREKAYARCALSVDTDTHSVEEIVEKILQFYKEKIA